MIQKILLSIFCCLMISNTFLFSQNLLQYIPSDATVVVGFNPTSVNNKVDVNALKQLDFCKEMMLELANGINSDEAGVVNDAINNPSQYGMDFNTQSFFFMKVEEDGSYFSYLFNLSDPTAFAEFFTTKLLTAERGLRIEKNNGMTIATVDGGSVSWNDKVAILSSANITRKYPEFDWGAYDDYDYEEEDFEYEEEETYEDDVVEDAVEEIEIIVEEGVNIKPGEIDGMQEALDSNSIVEEEIVEETYDWESEDDGMTGGETDEEYETRSVAALDQFSKRLFALSADSTMLTNTKFAKHLLDRNDANMWLDYSFITQMGMEDIPGMDPSMEAFLAGYKGLYEGSYLSMKMNFDPGVINVESDAIMSKEWMDLMRKSLNAKANRKFYKYLKGENLLGYMFFNYDMESMLKGSKDLMMPMFESIPMAGPMMEDLLGIVDIVVDEDAIYEFFKGDFCMAFTGMREFENEITTYEYDEEFNAIEKQEISKKTLPEFVMMMSYGNEENLKKFFRLGEKMGGLEKKGLYYEIPATASLGMNMYAAYHKGILFFTNDTDLVANSLTAGFPSGKRIAKQHRKRMKKNAQVFFWDVPKSLNSASELGIPFGLSGDQMVNVSKQSLESVLVTSPKVFSNSINTFMKFKFVNKQMNSLDQLFNYINEIYLVDAGSQSM